ncbi:uroporphyrinogen-III synthase [Muricoccus nepalensis]|uniref:uroporphyrinogen-III synthase n=1 Tax=Muricoccus nepalensis TaxID=1854500 RepID=UPI0013867C13|nr:uroporphyrinogen-III synthase [Roseomonas nepalensis]
MAEATGSPRPACLITRPEPGAAATAARVEALGWHPVLAPALRLAPLPMAPAPEARAALVASAAAIPALAAACPPGLPVLAVGEGTARAARAAGFTAVSAAGGDAESLLAHATARLLPAAGPVLLAAGEGYGDELAEALLARGFAVIRRDAYAATEATGLPPPARDALVAGSVRSALFFSPRSAAAAVSLIRAAGLGAAATAIRALALSGRVALALDGLPWGGLDVASRPDQDTLLGLLGPAPPLAPHARPEG